MYERFDVYALDSHSTLLDYWTWLETDYSIQKAHAITLVNDEENHVLAAGHNHTDPAAVHHRTEYSSCPYLRSTGNDSISPCSISAEDG